MIPDKTSDAGNRNCRGDLLNESFPLVLNGFLVGSHRTLSTAGPNACY